MLLWPLVHTPSVAIPDASKDAEFESFEHVGFGLLRPLQRDEKGNFATGTGPRLWKSMIGQVLGTLCQSDSTTGELLWRTEFGSLCDTIRHRGNTPATQAIGQVWVVDAVRRWLPNFVVQKVDFKRDGRALYCFVTFDVLDARGNVLGTGNTAKVPLL